MLNSGIHQAFNAHLILLDMLDVARIGGIPNTGCLMSCGYEVIALNICNVASRVGVIVLQVTGREHMLSVVFPLMVEGACGINLMRVIVLQGQMVRDQGC